MCGGVRESITAPSVECRGIMKALKLAKDLREGKALTAKDLVLVYLDGKLIEWCMSTFPPCLYHELSWKEVLRELRTGFWVSGYN